MTYNVSSGMLNPTHSLYCRRPADCDKDWTTSPRKLTMFLEDYFPDAGDDINVLNNDDDI